MPNDYEVFQPSNERLAQIIVGILENRGYFAGYQLGYPNNKVFIRVNTKEEANKISGIIRKFMRKQDFGETGNPTAKLNALTNKLTDLIPQGFETKKIEKLLENMEKNKTEDLIPEAPKIETPVGVDVEELKSLITERIKFLNAQMTKHRKDRANEMRTVEIDTLNWVLRIIP
jgi:hypothetical protein